MYRTVAKKIFISVKKDTIMGQKLTHLQQLEEKSIHIIRH